MSIPNMNVINNENAKSVLYIVNCTATQRICCAYELHYAYARALSLFLRPSFRLSHAILNSV